MILAGIAEALGRADRRPALPRLLQVRARGQARASTSSASSTPRTTTAGYKLDDIMAGKYGPPGGALMIFRTYPRIPFYEQVHDSEPFHTDTGRLHAYATCPRRSSTARTSSSTAKGRRRRPTCRT